MLQQGGGAIEEHADPKEAPATTQSKTIAATPPARHLTRCSALRPRKFAVRGRRRASSPPAEERRASWRRRSCPRKSGGSGSRPRSGGRGPMGAARRPTRRRWSTPAPGNGPPDDAGARVGIAISIRRKAQENSDPPESTTARGHHQGSCARRRLQIPWLTPGRESRSRSALTRGGANRSIGGGSWHLIDRRSL